MKSIASQSIDAKNFLATTSRLLAA